MARIVNKRIVSDWLEFYLASGLDSIIESNDTYQNLDNILTIKVINTGHKEKWWWAWC